MKERKQAPFLWNTVYNDWAMSFLCCLSVLWCVKSVYLSLPWVCCFMS